MSTEAINSENMTYRRARVDDVPTVAALIAAAHLPPLFIEEHLHGFVAAERDGELWACGGLEGYEDSGVIRSVVVDERGRGLGLGQRIAEMLLADAKRAGAKDVYLFTGDAAPFWRRFGFVEISMAEWRPAPRLCWQYQFLSQNSDLVPEIHTMWREA